MYPKALLSGARRKHARTLTSPQLLAHDAWAVRCRPARGPRFLPLYGALEPRLGRSALPAFPSVSADAHLYAPRPWRTWRPLMNHSMAAYGLWPLVIINSTIFIMFAFSFTYPRSKRGWRSFRAFSAFIVALFVEMYGFPLTQYFLAPYLQSRFPSVGLLTHDYGHLWYTLLVGKGDPHLNPIHILSEVLIFGGFFVVASAWNIPTRHRLTLFVCPTSAIYRVRRRSDGLSSAVADDSDSRYVPVLVVMCVRLARREEADVRRELGSGYEGYASRVPAFFPRFGRPVPSARNAPRPTR